jgi:predicted AAA+ superfamily ATPase
VIITGIVSQWLLEKLVSFLKIKETFPLRILYKIYNCFYAWYNRKGFKEWQAIRLNGLL